MVKLVKAFIVALLLGSVTWVQAAPTPKQPQKKAEQLTQQKKIDLKNNKMQREDFLKFYKEQFKKYSPDQILDLRYANDKGFHTVATREIQMGEPVIEIPCQYALGICNNT